MSCGCKGRREALGLALDAATRRQFGAVRREIGLVARSGLADARAALRRLELARAMAGPRRGGGSFPAGGAAR